MITSKRSSAVIRTAGFTLVELLVVFAIIAILAALTATAVFKFIAVQQANNTRSTITSISSVLNKQWATVIRDHKNDNIPVSIMNMAGNDVRRARVIWIYANIKREFPMNLSEAQAPSWIPPQLINAAAQVNGASVINVIQSSDLPPKPGYIGAIQRAAAIQGAQFSGNTSDPTVWPFESAFTLLMALQQNRGGIAFTEESVAANALASEIFTWQVGPPPQRAATPMLMGPKMLVDAWGTPLAFYRFPFQNTDFSSTSGSSPISSSLRSAQFPDPIDPEGTLLDPRWNNFTNWSSLQGVWWFERYFHTIHSGINQQSYVPLDRYLEPVVVSAGPDHVLGFQSVGNVLVGPINPVATILPAPTFPDEMIVDPSTAGAWSDNITSYQLGSGGTGNK